MSSSFTPIDPATIAALNAGGEKALEQIFRSNFNFLLETALERLKGENAAAPRLIAATMREFWDERDGFHNSAEVEAFFNEEFRHRARAVRARLAAVHRFEKAEGVTPPTTVEPPTANALWTEIAAALHQPVLDPATVAKRRREHSSHGVAENIATVAKRAAWRTPAIIVVAAAVVAVVGVMLGNAKSRAAMVNQLLGSADAEAITTRAGQLGSATLADGSVAHIGPEARLVLVPRFGSEYRTLSLNGTASFAVSADGAHDFEARVGDIAVVSAAGRFAVRDYADENYRMIRATEGDLSVRLASGQQTLPAGQALYVARDGAASRAATEEEIAQAFGWVDGRLVLRDVTVADAAQQLWRWYGIDVTVPDTAVAARVLSLSVPLESSQAAIGAIEGGASATFRYVNNRAVFLAARVRR